MKVLKFRLYPTKKQRTVFKKYLDVCRNVYNKCLEYKITEYKQERTVSEFAMNNQITQWRNTTEPWMKASGIALLHDVSRRIDKSFKNFYRKLKLKDGKSGFPRFKHKDRYNSFTISRFACKIKNSKIRLTDELGYVKLIQHRAIEGNTKGCVISRNKCGDWFISIMYEPSKTHVKPLDETLNIGIDFGCSHVATFSNGEKIENPKFYKKAEKELAKAQRKKRKDVVCKIQKKTSNRRHDFCHKLTNCIVKRHDLIFVEDVKIQKLQKDNYKSINKSLSDGAWGMLSRLLSYKAEEAGKIFGKVNPAYTSQTCSNCGKIHELELKDRVLSCPCGHVQDRDVNAARNILRLGLQSLAQA